MSFAAANEEHLRGLPWMTDETWKELSGPTAGGNILQNLGLYLREDPANGRQLAHVISCRLEKTVERLLEMGASADAQAYGPGEIATFHPLDRSVSASAYPWSERISRMLFEAASRPFSMRPIRPLLGVALENPEAVAWCLSQGADPDEVSEAGYTGLAAGAMSTDKHISLLTVRRSMRLLLVAGADVDFMVPHPSEGPGAAPSMSAAGCAAWAERWPLVRLLLARGADPELGGECSVRSLASCKGFTPGLRWLAACDRARLNARSPSASPMVPTSPRL